MELRVLNDEENPYKPDPFYIMSDIGKERKEAFKEGNLAQFQRDIKAFVELVESSEYEIGLVGQGNFYAVPERTLESLKQLVEG